MNKRIKKKIAKRKKDEEFIEKFCKFLYELKAVLEEINKKTEEN